jgi:hypothetical protein
MKNFQEYLAESQRTYNYRIKIVGDVEPNLVKALEEKLKQFDPVKVSAVKKTPIQLKPADFPAHANESVSAMDCEFRYPAIEPQIQQIAQLLGLDPNRIRMLTVPYEDSMIDEKKKLKIKTKICSQTQTILLLTQNKKRSAKIIQHHMINMLC